MTLIEVKFPEDFEQKYQEYRTMLLDVLKEKKIEEEGQIMTASLAESEPLNVPENLHLQIETAKKLILKEPLINQKKHTFGSLSEDFGVTKEGIIALAKNDLVGLDKYFLHREYINQYRKDRKELEAMLHRLEVASLGSGRSFDTWKSFKNTLSDKYCGLGKAIYTQLENSIEIEINAFSFHSLIGNLRTRKFISFTLKFFKSKVEKFLDEKADFFIKNELELSSNKQESFFSYEKQKADFIKTLKQQIAQGFPANNLRVNPKEWGKDYLAKCNPVETALAMEKEGLIKIKDITKSQIQIQVLESSALQVAPPASKTELPTEKQTGEELQNTPKTFQLNIKDRYIWINDYLLSKPHAVGSNLSFFEHVRSKPANTLIKKSDLPQFLQEDIGNKDFAKILNELGFKDELLRTFFPKRSKKGGVAYRGDKVSKKDLENAGINTALLIKQLELAHLKNNPK